MFKEYARQKKYDQAFERTPSFKYETSALLQGCLLFFMRTFLENIANQDCSYSFSMHCPCRFRMKYARGNRYNTPLWKFSLSTVNM